MFADDSAVRKYYVIAAIRRVLETAVSTFARNLARCKDFRSKADQLPQIHLNISRSDASRELEYSIYHFTVANSTLLVRVK